MAARALQGFDTSRTERMNAMFGGCVSLRGLDPSSFEFSRAEQYDDFIPEQVYPGWQSLFG